jgi:hypothetical protein
MERRATILALALTIPLILYSVPYAYASVTSSAYVIHSSFFVVAQSYNNVIIGCNIGDYAVSGGYATAAIVTIAQSQPTKGGAPFLSNGNRPDGWQITGFNTASLGGTTESVDAWVVCQTPVTVAGIGVPEFGSLYVVIALGAIVYFMLSRRFARQPAVSAQV